SSRDRQGYCRQSSASTTSPSSTGGNSSSAAPLASRSRLRVVEMTARQASMEWGKERRSLQNLEWRYTYRWLTDGLRQRSFARLDGCCRARAAPIGLGLAAGFPRHFMQSPARNGAKPPPARRHFRKMPAISPADLSSA